MRRVASQRRYCIVNVTTGYYDVTMHRSFSLFFSLFVIPCGKLNRWTLPALQQAGSVQQVDNGKHGYIQQVVADQDCDIDVIWSQAHDRSLRADHCDRRWSGAAVSG